MQASNLGIKKQFEERIGAMLERLRQLKKEQDNPSSSTSTSSEGKPLSPSVKPKTV